MAALEGTDILHFFTELLLVTALARVCMSVCVSLFTVSVAAE